MSERVTNTQELWAEIQRKNITPDIKKVVRYVYGKGGFEKGRKGGEQSRIAEMFGVTRQYVSQLVKRERELMKKLDDIEGVPS